MGKYEAFIKALNSSNYILPIPNPSLSTTPNNLRLDYIYQDLRLTSGKILSIPTSCSPTPPNEDTEAGDEEVTPEHESSPFAIGSPLLKRITSQSSMILESASSSDLKKEFRSNIMLSIGPQRAKYKFVDCALLLKQMGFTIYATENTHYFYKTHSIDTVLVNKPSQTNKCPDAIKMIESGTIHFVINIPANKASKDSSGNYKTDGYQIRRKAVDFNVALISNAKLAKLFVKSLAKKYLKSYEFAFDDEFLHIKSWREYMQSANRY